ncbi:MAG: TonB-dependent receptor [Pseudomonadota bacterium]
MSLSRAASITEKRYSTTITTVVLLGTTLVASAHAKSISENLANLSLEELGNIEITSVSKRPERLSDAPASVFVITSEDIRRSGVANLPDALRLAPNVQVAQVSASGYAISARGFNSSAANKLLVLIDGRSVYTPLFSGVFWDVQDVMLEDVERIEVISGPGGTLWGVNAVNGVINVVTRSAKNTQGALIAAGGGNREANGAMRYGGTLGANGNYRVYGKYFDRDSTKTESGDVKNDAWHKGQIGFRADWGGSTDQFTLQGNAYNGAEHQPLPGTIAISGINLALGTIDLSGVNLITGWDHRSADGSSFSMHAYYDRTERSVPPTFSENLDIFDLQIQHSLQPTAIHAAAWGAEYRYAMDNVTNSQYVAFLPARQNQKWISLFIQDEMTLRKDLRLTLGGRLERNDYTGNEFLPNARLAWKFAPEHLLWTAFSRTVRAPSRLDHDTFVPGKPPFLLVGGPEVRSEIAKIYEIGYRGQPTPQFTYSATLFHADYDHLRTQEIVFTTNQLFVFYGNGMEGSTNGIEMWGAYQASRNWRLSAGFSGLRERLQLKPDSNDVTAAQAQQGHDPAQSWLFRSSLDLPKQTELDMTVRHVASLSNPAVPDYTTIDLRFGWKPRPEVELSVTGQNLFGSEHAEFADISTRTELGRSVFFKIVSQF